MLGKCAVPRGPQPWPYVVFCDAWQGKPGLIYTNCPLNTTIWLVLMLSIIHFLRQSQHEKRQYALEKSWPHNAAPYYWIMLYCLFIHYVWSLCELCYEHVVYIWFHNPQKKFNKNAIKFCECPYQKASGHQSGQYIHSNQNQSQWQNLWALNGDRKVMGRP